MTTLSPRTPIDTLALNRRAPSPAPAAARLIVASIAGLAVLQIVALRSLDPLTGTISGMVHAPGGGATFLTMAMVCIAGSSMLATVLWRAGARKAAVALALWCAALAVAALFPTDPPGALSISISAEIHRDAAAVMFIAVPLAGFLAAAHRFGSGADIRTAQRRLRLGTVVCALIGAGQLLVSIPSLFPDSVVATWPSVQFLAGVRGLAERVLFIALLLVLLTISKLVALVSGSARPARNRMVTSHAAMADIGAAADTGGAADTSPTVNVESGRGAFAYQIDARARRMARGRPYGARTP